MKVVCDNCRAVYRIPDEKLVKEVNKATCRNCGHKMLIPRPRPGGDPDEPTNVRAVPPTPMGAPVRARTGEDSDATMPRGVGTRDIPLTPGTPLGTPQRTATPQPAPAAPATPAAPAFDPGGDMVLAMLGAMASMFGALIMAVDDSLPVIGIGLFISLAGSFTTLMVLATGNRGRRPASKAVSIMLSPVIAALAAVIVVGLHFGASNYYVPPNDIPAIDDAAVAAAAAVAAQEPAPEPAAPEAPAAAEADDTQAPAEEEPTEEPDIEAAPAASTGSSTPEPSSSSSSSSRSSSRPSSASSSSPSSRPSSTSPSRSSTSSSRSSTSSSRSSTSSGSSSSRSRDDDLFGDTDDGGSSASSRSDLPDSVPVETIDVILRNNKDVKLCFAAYYKENGALPPRVDTRFTVAASGAVTAAEVTNAEYVATSLDTCMSRAIKKLAFPQTSGGAKKYNYPFILQ